MRNLFWLIPLVPLAGVAVNGLFGSRLSRRAVGILACATIAVAFLLSAASVLELSGLPAEERRFSATLGAWMPLPGLEVSWGFALDPLSSIMIPQSSVAQRSSVP